MPVARRATAPAARRTLASRSGNPSWIAREPAGRHNQRYQNHKDVAIRRRIGRTGALLGTWCGATGPQAPAEPVKVETGPNPAPESATAPAKQPPQEPTEFRDRDCPAWVHFPAPDWAVRRSWPMAHTWRWLRTISSPPEMAGVAIRGSAMSLRARISNLGPAFATKISPSSLER